MKYKALGVIFLAVLAVAFFHPIKGIFSPTECEILREEISNEQAIGFESWKIFDEYRNELLESKRVTFSQLPTLLTKINIVYESDESIFLKIEENTQCFSPKFIAKNRERLSWLDSSLESVKMAQKNLQTYGKNELLNQELLKNLATWYPEYLDWETGEVLSP